MAPTMARALTDIAIRNLKPKAKDYGVVDPTSGVRIEVRRSGHKSYLKYFRLNGEQGKLTWPMSVSLSRGIDPRDAKKDAKQKAATAAANTVRAVCESYLKREGGKLRSADQRQSILERQVYPKLGDRPIAEVKRSEIVRLLDGVEDKAGPVAASMVLAVLRKIMNWHAARDDEFRSPIVRGMARHKPKERARQRILSDPELQAVWTTANKAPGPFPVLLKFLLLTAARRNEASTMTWEEVDGADWTLPAVRNKTRLDLVRPLSKAAQAVLDELREHRIDGCRYVFSTDGKRPVSGFGKFKSKFDTAAGVTGWTLHDCRRTARSLLSRAGVSSDHAEQCLGHVIPGVRGTYDRHAYYNEKKRAYEALAAQIERIANPPLDNITPLRRRRR